MKKHSTERYLTEKEIFDLFDPDFISIESKLQRHFRLIADIKGGLNERVDSLEKRLEKLEGGNNE
jgi:hypothetical protein